MAAPPPWQDLLHGWWSAVSAEDAAGDIAERALTGLADLPEVGASFLARAGSAALWADGGGVRSAPELAESFARCHEVRFTERPARIVEIASAALPPVLARAVSEAGGKQVLLAAHRSATGEPGVLGVAVEVAEADTAERLAQVRDILAAAERTALDRRRRADRLVEDAILSEASLRMGSSLDIEDTLRAVVRMMVPALADGAAVHVDRAGRMVPVAVAHVDARRESTLAEHLDHRRWAGAPLVEPHRERPDDDSPRESGLPADANLDTMAVAVLRARGRDVGLLTLFHRAGSTRRADPGFLRNLAGRAASAIDNAALYAQQLSHVVSLQRHLLPAALPPVPGVEVTSAYRVAEHSLDVGGDFYGLLPRPSGTMSALIGDICGRGAEAAALTGLARHTLETLLAEGHSVERAIGALNAKMLANDTTRFLTLAVAEIGAAQEGVLPVHLYSAGHPPPLIVRRDGTVVEADCSGMLVGVRPELHLRPAVTDLRLGEHLLLYTDGLTEARDENGRFFEDELPDILTRLREHPLPDLAEILTTGADRFRVDDDTAVLIFRHTGPTVLDETLPVEDIEPVLRETLTRVRGEDPVSAPALIGRLRAYRETGVRRARLRVRGAADWTRVELDTDEHGFPNGDTVWTELT
ncbi:PP2C family protein-serine/threonine phosphatase [Nocardia takedensis]|uniref:PP2C family protein-serine/threonine phosphatase n=1 Tax=Nocardia takedensis TaxID=259390 RepID=UPI0012F6B8F3|nr:PP2C family protein-serine/threonine phosphatase [Nocardia takedensis]